MFHPAKYTFTFHWSLNSLFSVKKQTLLTLVLRWLLPMAICYALFDAFLNKAETVIVLGDVLKKESFTGYCLFVLLLMPANWALEAFKWQRLTSIPFLHSYRVVLTSVSMNMLGLLGLGDVAGRLWATPTKNKWSLIGAVAINKAAQLTPTLFFGIWACGFLMQKTAIPPLYLYISVGVFAVIVLLLLFLRPVVVYLKRFTRYRSLIALFVQKTRSKIQLEVMVLAFLRYAVFALQFCLVLVAFGVEADFFVLFQGVSWVFLVKSMVPAVSVFSDLATRELSAVYFFGWFGVGAEPVALATLFIWLVNIILPAMVGLFFVARLHRS